jgi:hypothetical protein
MEQRFQVTYHFMKRDRTWNRIVCRNVAYHVSKWLLITILSSAVSGCARPTIVCSHIHPNRDMTITLTARAENVPNLHYLRIEINGIPRLEDQSNELELQINLRTDPACCSNTRLRYTAVAVQENGQERRRSGWIFVADPRGHFYATESQGRPTRHGEETGAKLFGLHTDSVAQAALDAILEYPGYSQVLEGMEAVSVGQEIFILTDLVPIDTLVAAVAYYSNRHMSYALDDGPEGNVVSMRANGYYIYDEEDIAQPADYTLEDSWMNTTSPYDYVGDCEDRAILHAALLRRLGFSPDYIWIVKELWDHHEYNIVLYEGAFRIMDWGRIEDYLDYYDTFSYPSTFAWNDRYSKRGIGPCQFWNLFWHVDNYPGGKGDGRIISPKSYFREVSP